MQNIIGFYKQYILFEQDGLHYVVNKQERKTLYKGENEELACKIFVMLCADFIDETFEKTEAPSQ